MSFFSYCKTGLVGLYFALHTMNPTAFAQGIVSSTTAPKPVSPSAPKKDGIGTSTPNSGPSSSGKGRAKGNTGKNAKTPPPPAKPEPLPELPPPLAEQTLPYPVRYISRPFTLPKGLNDAHLNLPVAAFSENGEEHVYVLPYFSNFQYRQSLTNDFNLIWNPLPLGVHYQPKRTETMITGVAWELGWHFQGNFGLRPQFTSYLRQTLNKKTAFEMELIYFSFIPFASAPSIWSSNFRLGPVYQQSERFAVSPRVALAMNNMRFARVYQHRTPIEAPGVLSSSTQITFPFSLWMAWTPSSNWDISLEYALLGSSFNSKQEAHIQMLTLGLTGRW